MMRLVVLPLALFSAFVPKGGEAYPGIARNIFTQSIPQLQYASRYLHRFGYMETSAGDEEELNEALKRFQKEMGLTTSGELDERTLQFMKKPRCGGQMIVKGSRRSKRFAHSSRWDKLTPENVLKLKWFISRYTSDMPVSEIRSLVKQSFDLWSTQTIIHSMPSVTLVFEEAEDEADADITILWAEGDHGDEYKFDDGGDEINILAHTFYPNYHKGTLNGDIHLDDAETWANDGRYGGTTFTNVFIHEIGHALGLGHSKQEEAIMFPVYKKHPREHEHFDLDDKCAINWNYIGPSNTCLFVWLMSEVVKKQTEQASNGMVANNVELSSKSETKTSNERLKELKTRLKHTQIQRCREDNRVRERLENKLQLELNVNPETAHEYSKLSCKFLNGLHREFREDPFALSIFGDSEPGSSPELLQRVKRHLTRLRHKRRQRHHRHHRHHGKHALSFHDDGSFNSEFFDRFLSLYTQ